MLPPDLVGPHVTLRGVREEDRAARRAWGWDEELERCYGSERGSGPMSDAEVQEWYDGLVAMQEDPACVPWVVDVGGALVGAAFLHSLRQDDRKARYAVGLLSREHLGQGWGREITGLVLDHAFDVLDLHRVDLRVLAFNERAIRSYERSGFVREGRERESCCLHGEWYDDVIMAVLADDHRARRGPAGGRFVDESGRARPS